MLTRALENSRNAKTVTNANKPRSSENKKAANEQPMCHKVEAQGDNINLLWV